MKKSVRKAEELKLSLFGVIRCASLMKHIFSLAFAYSEPVIRNSRAAQSLTFLFRKCGLGGGVEALRITIVLL